MQRGADEIFRVKDLSLLKSPMPTHIRSASAATTPSSTAIASGNKSSPAAGVATPTMVRPSPMLLAKPTPKPMGPPPARPKFAPLSSCVSKNVTPVGSSRLGTSSATTSIVVSQPVFPLKPKEQEDCGSEEAKREENFDEEDARQKEQDSLTESIFNDIVEESKIEGSEDAAPPVAVDAEMSVQAEGLIDTVEEEKPAKRPRETKKKIVQTQPLAKTADEKPLVVKGSQIRSARKTAALSVDEELHEAIAIIDGTEDEAIVSGQKAEETTATMDEAVKENISVSNIEEEKVAIVIDEKAAAVATVVKDVAPMPVVNNSSKEYNLDKWYLQRIPNSPRFSGIEDSQEWIVLVGIKSDPKSGREELWHSSIVTGPENWNGKRILTGSGRLYNLAKCDPIGWAQSGFPAALLRKFAQGFPADWKELLLKELAPDSLALKPKKTPANGTPKWPMGKQTPPSKNDVNQTAKTPLSKKTPVEKRTPVRKASPKTPHSSIPERSVLLGSTTRSGRKVVSPIPFWDSKAAANAQRPSPSTLHIKRKWGNLVELD